MHPPRQVVHQRLLLARGLCVGVHHHEVRTQRFELRDGPVGGLEGRDRRPVDKDLSQQVRNADLHVVHLKDAPPPTGEMPAKLAGRTALSSRSRNPSCPSASNAWLPRVRKSTTESKAAALSLVIPRPQGAEFSALATTAWSRSSSRSSGTRSRTAEHPALPTTSPTNSNLKFKEASQQLAHGGGQVTEQVRRDHALRGPAGPFEPELGRPPMRPRASPGRLVGVQPACE